MNDQHVPVPENPLIPRSSRRIIVLSAPSGAGKTTIAHRLLEHHPEWRFSVSATTRPRRPNEVDGSDYYFLTVEEFRRRIEHGDLVEWEEIYGNLYGTLKSEVARQLLADEGSRVIFDVDVKGAHAIRNAFPHEAFLIFVAPPSFDELVRRLRSRQTESDESIQRRVERAEMEMGMQAGFDTVIVNDQVDRAVGEIETLLGQ
ncbi:MAG: guanylate kinase [Candidatus Kapaibacterium sp.]